MRVGLRDGAVDQRAGDVANANDVGADALLCMLDADALRQDCGARLARRVRVALVADTQGHAARDRGKVDDIARALRLKDGKELVNEIEVSGEVERDARLPSVLGHCAVRARGQRSGSEVARFGGQG